MERSKPHCLVLPYPSQGHINPLVEFSKRLDQKGLKVTLVITNFLSKTLQEAHQSCSNIGLKTISDGFDDGGMAAAGSYEAYASRFRQVGAETLAERVREDGKVDCIVYDALLPWALDVAREFGVVGAAFFTQSCAVGNILYHVHQGRVKVPTGGHQVLVPGLPPLEPHDMPSYLYVVDEYPGLCDMLVNQFSNVHLADWVLCNTVHALEEEVVDWMSKIWPSLRTIGPTIPSMYLDKRLKDDTSYGFSLFNDGSCMNWLNHQPKASVVYVSFGSIASLKPDQMQELALGLKKSNAHFLWVVRAQEESKLPAHFVEDTSSKGLVVPWCPQLEVLAHEAVGCFLTHCGWNSTLEAMSLGVPMVAMPQWTDQGTNAKFIEDVWGVGIKIRVDENGFARQEEVEHCVREVMGGEKGREMRNNACKWKRLAIEAANQGGSSDVNIDEFVASLLQHP